MLNTRDAAPPMSDVANDALGNLGCEVDRVEPTQQAMFGTGSAARSEEFDGRMDIKRSRWSLLAKLEWRPFWLP